MELIWTFLSEKFRKHLMDKILYGSGTERIYFRYENDFGQVRENYIAFEGVISNVERRYKETSSDYIREQMEKYMAQQHCPTCKGISLEKRKLCCSRWWQSYRTCNIPFGQGGQEFFEQLESI